MGGLKVTLLAALAALAQLQQQRPQLSMGIEPVPCDTVAVPAFDSA